MHRTTTVAAINARRITKTIRGFSRGEGVAGFRFMFPIVASSEIPKKTTKNVTNVGTQTDRGEPPPKDGQWEKSVAPKQTSSAGMKAVAARAVSVSHFIAMRSIDFSRSCSGLENSKLGPSFLIGAFKLSLKHVSFSPLVPRGEGEEISGGDVYPG